MGVPTFYRWLCQKYPKVVLDAVEEREVWTGAEFAPADLSGPNPSGLEFDNLYIDMNGVVHPCAHPENAPQPATEAEMFQNVCDYVDRVVNIVRPRRLLYLCLDGVAPRAKMNQQRSRRYKAAHEAARADDSWLALAQQWRAQGREAPPPKARWDSNVITPGTPFMDRLANALRFYVARRIRSSSYWRGLLVLVSDSNVPGEGEHKVMRYVRQMRGLTDPNTVHCIHGMDADLIMLGLSTHEPHFYIVREIVTDSGTKHANAKKDANANTNVTMHDGIRQNESFRASWKPLQFLQLPVLREYLAHELFFPPEELVTMNPETGTLVTLNSNLERHIDDFVFMCSLVGNDFLPHLPSLSIHNGSIDQMIILYKHVFARIGGYLTQEGELCPAQVQGFLNFLANAEHKILESNVRRNERQQQNNLRQKAESERSKRAAADMGEPASKRALILVETQQSVDKSGETETDKLSELSPVSIDTATDLDVIAASDVQRVLTAEDVEEFRKTLVDIQYKASDATFQQYDKDPKLGEGDYKDYRARYYKYKFNCTDNEVETFARATAKHFARGLQWVLKYYKLGVPAWEWYYPFYYAPFASDLAQYGLTDNFLNPLLSNAPTRLPNLSDPFDMSHPVKPLQQLLAVLPPRSAACLPEPFRKLMLEADSPLVDFYPVTFHEDCDGKKQSWQWIALLPFIDGRRLVALTDELDDQLTENERRRNRLGSEYMFMATDHPMRSQLTGECIFSSSVCGTFREPGNTPLPINPQTKLCDVEEEGFEPFDPHDACSIYEYSLPPQEALFPYHAWSTLIRGAQPPPPKLTEGDFVKPQHKGRGPFNLNVATRIIMQVIGGRALREYEAEQYAIRQQQDAQRMNAATIINIQNVDRQQQQSGGRQSGGRPSGGRQSGGGYQFAPQHSSGHYGGGQHGGGQHGGGQHGGGQHGGGYAGRPSGNAYYAQTEGRPSGGHPHPHSGGGRPARNGAQPRYQQEQLPTSSGRRRDSRQHGASGRAPPPPPPPTRWGR